MIPTRYFNLDHCPDNDIKGATIHRRKTAAKYPMEGGTKYSWGVGFLRTAKGNVYLFDSRYPSLHITSLCRTDRRALAAALGVRQGDVERVWENETVKESERDRAEKIGYLHRDAERLGFKVVPK